MSQKNHVCPECNIQYKKRYNLNQHARKMHPEKAHEIIRKKTYNIVAWCNDCGKSFSKLSNLKKHVRLFHPDKFKEENTRKKCKIIAEKCEECGKTFSRKFNFHQHIKNFHSGDDRKKYKKSTKTSTDNVETFTLIKNEEISFSDQDCEEITLIKEEYNDVSQENLPKKCRGCLSDEDEAIHDLFNKEKQTDENEPCSLVDILLNTTGIKIKQENGFPTNLCQKCTNAITNFYEFKITFQKTEIYLNKIRELNTSNTTKCDLDEHGTFQNETEENFVDSDIEETIFMEIEACDQDNDIFIAKNDETTREDESFTYFFPKTAKKPSQLQSKNFNCDKNIETSPNKNYKESNNIQQTKIRQTIEKIDEINDRVKNTDDGSDHRIAKQENQRIIDKPTELCINNIEDTDKNNSKLELGKSVFTILDDEIHKMRTTKFKKRVKTGVFDSKLHSNIVYTVVEEKRNISNQSTKSEKSKLRSFICDKCGMGYKTKEYLKNHQETHSDEKKYVCEYCNKALKLKSSYFKHIKLHIKPRQIVCEMCGQKFNEKSHLKLHHKAIHLGVKDYQCPLCEKAFALKSTLDRHKEARHNPCRERKWACQLCDLVYMDRRQLSRHHRKKHPGMKFEVKEISLS